MVSAQYAAHGGGGSDGGGGGGGGGGKLGEGGSRVTSKRLGICANKARRAVALEPQLRDESVVKRRPHRAWGRRR